MKKNKAPLWPSVILLSAMLRADAHENQPEQSPQTYRMELVYIFDKDPAEFVFVIGNVGFKSVDSLKKFLSSVPAGSTLEWAPGCIRWVMSPCYPPSGRCKNSKRFV
jgi:hypothetical protein